MSTLTEQQKAAIEEAAIYRAKYELHMRRKASIEEAAKRHAYKCDPDNVNPPKWADHYFSFKEGLKEAIEHPERYGLTDRKPLGIQKTRELVNQMLAEEISFSRFVELINKRGTYQPQQKKEED